jgi:lysyl-tRNA synthetase class 2
MNPSLWQPTATLQNLQRRAEIVWLLRQFFHDQGFAEVQTPILSHDTVIDRHIDPVSLPSVELGLAGLGNGPLFLQTSPEFCMKRLLAAGMQAIYELKPVFRAGERGNFHNPEFTMLEWYRVGDDFEQGVQLLSDVVRTLLGSQEVERLTYQRAFQLYAACDPLSAPLSELSGVAVGRQLGVDGSWSSQRDDWLNLLFSEVVQPRLGHEVPTIITHYPATQAALACLSPADPRTAERYELFVRGVELANGYHELLDPVELRRRNEQGQLERERDGKPPLPSDSRLLAAMQAGLPACSGCALGLDRLLMVAFEAVTIDEVIAFPIERA